MPYRSYMAVFLAGLLLAELGHEPLLRAWYAWGNDSFTAALCENRDRPEVMCHGHCQMQQLDANHEKESGGDAIAPSDWSRSPAVYLPVTLPRLPQLLLSTERPRPRAGHPWRHDPNHPGVFRPPIT